MTLNKAVSLIGADANTTIIQAISNQRVMTVTGPTITNSVVISGLTFTGGKLGGHYICPIDCGAGILITNTASPLLTNLIITGNFSTWGASGLYAVPGGILTLRDVKVLSNSTGFAPAAYISGSVKIIGGRFANNIGGGLAVQGELMLTGTEFVNNEADYPNAGAGAWVAGTAELNDSWFERNHSADRSGYSSAGGLYASGILALNRTTFVSNTSNSYGGGLVLGGGAGTINDTVFRGNTANYYGGGALVGPGGDLSIDGSQFLSNTSLAGGGLFVNRPLTITNSNFENNVSHTDSGGAHGSCGGLLAGDSIYISGSSFIGNSAEDDGGAICHTDRTPSWPAGNGYIVNTVFARNTATNTGATLYLNSAGADVILHSTIGDVSFNPGSAIVVLTGTVGVTNTIIASHTIGINQIDGSVYQDYNLFFSNATNKVGTIGGGAHEVLGDPRFADPIGSDYHVITGSAAIDAGINAGVTTDIDGNARPLGNGFDVGADEFWLPSAYIYLPLSMKNH